MPTVNVSFLVAPGPYNGECEALYDATADRVSHTAYLRPDLGRDLSLKEYRDQTGTQWRVVSREELNGLETEYEDRMITNPSPITQERYIDMLEVLPPVRWRLVQGVEVFHLSETLRGTLVHWFAKTYAGCFEWVDRCTASDSALVEKAIEASKSFPPDLSVSERAILLSSRLDGTVSGTNTEGIDKLISRGFLKKTEEASKKAQIELTEAGKAVRQALKSE